MMKSMTLVMTVFFGAVLSLQAQQTQLRGVCGMSDADRLTLTPRLIANRDAAESATAGERAITWIPVYFHLTADASGNGRLRHRFPLDELCDLNEAYAPGEIQFYLAKHPTYGIFDETLNNNNIYDTQTSYFSMNTHRHQNALNLFAVNTAVNGAGGLDGVILGYYNTDRDWVVLRKDEIGTNSGTAPHEIGHFFSLLHTHSGWDAQPFDSSFPTWPIAPAMSPGGVPTERMNGTNCTIAGDFLCDTRPDYNFGFGWPNCNYDGGAKDPLGVLVDPMEDNFMGYFISCAPYSFTDDQFAAIKQDINTPARNYLDNTFQPVSTSITTPSDMLQVPNDNVTTTYYDEVTLQWQPVSGATYYLLEVDIVNSFISPFVKSYVLDGNASTSKTLTDLQSNKTYFWRVRPFNEYVTCALAQTRHFKTSTVSVTGTVELPTIEGWQLSPNPMFSDGEFRLTLSATEAFEADLLVFDAMGKQYFRQSAVKFAAGENTQRFDLPELAPGLYWVSLRNAQGSSTRQLSVVR